MLKGLLVLVVVAITLGIYGLFLSAWLGRTGRATVVGFISVMGLIVGPLGRDDRRGPFRLARRISAAPFLAVSPISMLSSAVDHQSPMSTAAG